MEVIPVPVLRDNYAYLLVDSATAQCAAVDPADADAIFLAAARHGLTITHVLTTHAHWDHAGGNEDVRARAPNVVVVAGKHDGVPCTLGVMHGDVVEIGENVEVMVLDTPCHTKGHVCYVAREKGGERKCVFSGDTLFVAGCGNFNGGSPQQMMHAMDQVLGKLADETEVFCGHNYTERNLRWASVVEPGNEAVAEKLEEARKKDEEGEFIRSTIGQEKRYNPFMRTRLPHLQEWAGCVGDPVATLLKIRQGKDEWGKTN